MAFFALSPRAARATFALLFVSAAVVTASSAISGCSSSSDAAVADSGAPVCPTTVAGAVDQPCSVERMVCPVGYLCGQFLNEQALCTCTSGKWACNDHAGTAIAAGQEPTCTDPGGGKDNQCPSDEGQTGGAPCITPGLICSYAGETCVGAPGPNTDQCQCVGGSPDGGLMFVCEPVGCPGAIVDAGADG